MNEHLDLLAVREAANILWEDMELLIREMKQLEHLRQAEADLGHFPDRNELAEHFISTRVENYRQVHPLILPPVVLEFVP